MHHTAKKHEMLSPGGDVVSIINMAEYCSDKDLDKHLMCRVSSGQRNSHKGWKRHVKSKPDYFSVVMKA